MTETKKKKKVSESTECKSGKHDFIVTQWYMHGGKNKAVNMRCRYCLMPLNLEELESKEWRESEL